MSIIRIAVIGITLGLAACTTAPQIAATSDDRIDSAYVNAVNHIARQRGLQVVWMRYPTRAENAVR